MLFHELLNQEIGCLDCTAKDLSQKSGISAAALSRYRSGERQLDPSSQAFDRLCAALAQVAAEQGLVDHTQEAIRARFCTAENFDTVDAEQLLQNFDALITALNISVNRLCRGINYDSSAVFRFRNRTRRPAEPRKFAAAVARFVTRELDSPHDRAILAQLLTCGEEELSDPSVCCDRLVQWLLSDKPEKADSVSGFLGKLDDFDLNEYIKSIHFDELKVPSIPFQIPGSKSYVGLREMMESELDFLKATVLSKSTAPVISYSDMPIKEMAQDPDFPKKWMFGMAMLLKKGLHLHHIHVVDRSFDELMLGLESWIPMYMTGQISPYYLKNPQHDVFLHLLKVSGAAALSGEAIAGYQADGKYYLTKSKKEIDYYTKRAKELLSCASPLMEIYRSENAPKLQAFLQADAQKPGKRRSILFTLPLYTMEDALLERILARHGLPLPERKTIRAAAIAKRKRVEDILANNPVEDEIPDISAQDFTKHALRLDLSGVFCEQDLFYTYEDYLAHCRSTEEFVRLHPNYALKKISTQTFRNLQILMHEGMWAMVSKGKAPAIHFVIHHPKLVEAIEQFTPPVVETEKEP